jgi:hypothetical protein
MRSELRLPLSSLLDEQVREVGSPLRGNASVLPVTESTHRDRKVFRLEHGRVPESGVSETLFDAMDQKEKQAVRG